MEAITPSQILSYNNISAKYVVFTLISLCSIVTLGTTRRETPGPRKGVVTVSSDTEMKMQIFDLKTAKDVHVLTVYVDNSEVRIVAVLGNLAWLPVGWREKLSELLKPSSEPNGVTANMHPVGLALVLSGEKSVLYWELHAQAIIEDYIKDWETAWPDVAAHPASRFA